LDKPASAVATFNSGFNCAQAVLSVFSEQFGLDKDMALRIACGFGAGMGRLQRTCGAVSGAYMVIGLKHGSFEPGSIQEAKERSYSLVREFTKQFEARNGTTDCMELIGVDFINGDQALASERVAKICPKMCSDAVEILMRIIR
jgi:C_GCAxxG_C_C family probable redox protein